MEQDTINIGDFLTDKEKEIASLIKRLNKDITTFFDIDKFIELMRDVIDKDVNFEFRSLTSRKFIDKIKPTFVIKISNEELLNNINSISNEEEQIDYVVEKVAKSILLNMSKKLTECIKDESKYEELFENVPEEIRDFVMGNMYTIRANIKGNNIQIVYFI